MAKKLPTTPDGRRIPQYCRHKRSGGAYVTINGKQIQLGEWDDTEGSPSRALYQRLIAEWRSSGYRDVVVEGVGPASGQTCRDVLVEFLDHLQKSNYSKSEYDLARKACSELTALYGDLPVSSLGVAQVRVLREQLVESGLSRYTVNRKIGRIKRAFRWLASEAIIPPSVSHAVSAVLPLQPGRTSAPEAESKGPALWKDVEKLMDHPLVGPRVKALVLFMWHTGARVGEAVLLAKSKIDTSQAVWVFEPEKHKTQHHGKRRRIPIGVKAQKVLAPWMKGRGRYLFNPKKESEDLLKVWEQMPAKEREELEFSNPKPGAVRSGHFDPRTISRLLKKVEAGFTPHQLRYAYLSRVRLEVGRAAAQLVGDHEDARTTDGYTQTAEWQQVLQVTEQMG